jgi:bidirectional [NiFe] hydrogenase diaphorase subunit
VSRRTFRDFVPFNAPTGPVSLGTTSREGALTDSTSAPPAAASASPGRRVDDEHPSGDDRFLVVDKHLKRVRYAQDQLIETLHVAQDVFGYLDEGILVYVARSLRLPPSMVYGVATFYQLFTFDPPGDHTCTVCTGTACFVKGADDIVAAVGDRYGVAAGDTTEDGRLTLKTARCLGSCGLAPVVLLDGAVHGREDAAAVLAAVGTMLDAVPVGVSGEGGEG